MSNKKKNRFIRKGKQVEIWIEDFIQLILK